MQIAYSSDMGCFLIGVTGKSYTKDGNPLLGSVSDDPYDVRTFVRSKHPKKGLAHVGTELVAIRPPSFEERGFFCRVGETSRGVNAAGLAFTSALLFEGEKQEKNPDPASFSELTKELMETCKTVDEGIDLFHQAGASNPPFSVLLADRSAVIAHIEAGGFGIEVLHRFDKDHPGAIFAVNCYQSEHSRKFNDPKAGLDNSANNNGVRLERGRELCERMKGGIGVDELAKILSDHANRERDPAANPLLEAWGFSICNHGTREKGDAETQPLPWGTVSAEILQPAENTLHYCFGWPCGESPQYGDQLLQEKSWGKFHPFTIPLEAPSGQTNELTTPEGEARKN